MNTGSSKPGIGLSAWIPGPALKGRPGMIVFVMLMVCVAAALAWAGHELAIYQSYYPAEIDIRMVMPEEAPAQIQQGKIQAYIGAVRSSAPMAAVETLGSFVVLDINPQSPLVESACAVTASVMNDLAERGSGFVFHPYPVTPFQGDYLYHADLAEQAKRRWSGSEGIARPAVKAAGGSASALVRRDWLAPGPEWDASLSEVDADALVAGAMTAVNGWLGPPWLRTGWFLADLLLTDGLTEPAARERLAGDVARLETGDWDGAVERINLERDLVGLLTGGCRRSVVGYTVKRNYFSDDYSAGIENIGYDAVSGFRSPMFVRTAKLKDFPWNGWLGIGIDGRPDAAWNPIAGFTDPFGRLLWFALGDPALMPAPNDFGWSINRVADVREAPAP
jgi:hypothetical protein